ncbi:hypothetical protein NDU88_011087 [Pleurodeles waltl]|uniref:Uncharacterized protein n=1 Tax=Pleurodeles waltl TaxID=8319 RepID=A0AAV7PWS3_PLEWA|nr:hypothetical protein NDU88_011087 [Pleurodeles waltl]
MQPQGPRCPPSKPTAFTHLFAFPTARGKWALWASLHPVVVDSQQHITIERVVLSACQKGPGHISAPAPLYNSPGQLISLLNGPCSAAKVCVPSGHRLGDFARSSRVATSAPQSRCSLSVVSQELAVTNRPLICTAGHTTRAFAVPAPHSSGHLFQRTLSLKHRRSLRAVSQELAVTNRPPVCTAGCRPCDSHLHRFSTPFLWPPFPAHSLLASPPQPQGRPTRACHYQSASDLHRWPRDPCFYHLNAPLFRPPLPVHSLPAAPPQPQGRPTRACHYQSAADLHRRPRGLCFHRLSTPSFRPPLTAYSLPAARPQPQGCLTKACRYQSAFDLHHQLPAAWPVLPPSQHPVPQATSFSTLSPCSTATASGPSPRNVPLPVGLLSAPLDASHVSRSFTVSAPRSSGHLFQRTLSLQHHRSLRAVFQELAKTN